MTLRTLAMTLVLCAPSGAQMLPFPGPTTPSSASGSTGTFVQYKQGSLTNGATTATVTFDSAVPSGHQVVLVISACISTDCGYISSVVGATGPTGAITPSSGPWIVSNLNANNTQVNAWLVPVTSSTSTFTVNYAAGMYWAAVTAAEFSGLNTTAPFDQATAIGSTVAATTATITPSDTTNATDLIVGHISMYNPTAVTPGSGFTEAGETSTGTEMEYRFTTSAGSYPCTWSFASDTYQGACLAIKLQ